MDAKCLVAMTSGWRCADLSEYLDWISTGDWGVRAIRCFEESEKKSCPSASSQAPMLAGVSMVFIGAAMPSGAGGNCQGVRGSDKSAYLIGQGAGDAL
jgi:hypothetical protein